VAIDPPHVIAVGQVMRRPTVDGRSYGWEAAVAEKARGWELRGIADAGDDDPGAMHHAPLVDEELRRAFTMASNALRANR